MVIQSGGPRRFSLSSHSQGGDLSQQNRSRFSAAEFLSQLLEPSATSGPGPLRRALENGAEDFRQALNSLSGSQRQDLESRYGRRCLEELASLSAERSPELFYSGLVQFAQALENEGQLELATRVFSSVAAVPLEDAPWLVPLQHRAQERLGAILGQGAALPRAEFLLRRLVEQSTEPSALVGMAVAAPVFRATRLIGLSRLATSPASGLWRGLAGRALVNSLAFTAEAASFTASTRATNEILGRNQEWTRRAVWNEFAGGALMLGSLRLTGALGRGALSPFANSTGTGARLAQALVPQAAMYAGILLTQRLEENFGLRERRVGATHAIDALATLLQFNFGGQIAHGLMGERGRLVEQNLEQRIQVLEASLRRPLSRPQAPTPALAGHRAWGSRLLRGAEQALYAPFWMMMGMGSLGGGVGRPRLPTTATRTIRIDLTPIRVEFVGPEVPRARMEEIERELRRLFEEEDAHYMFSGQAAPLLESIRYIRNRMRNGGPSLRTVLRVDGHWEVHRFEITEEGQAPFVLASESSTKNTGTDSPPSPDSELHETPLPEAASTEGGQGDSGKSATPAAPDRTDESSLEEIRVVPAGYSSLPTTIEPSVRARIEALLKGPSVITALRGHQLKGAKQSIAHLVPKIQSGALRPPQAHALLDMIEAAAAEPHPTFSRIGNAHDFIRSQARLLAVIEGLSSRGPEWQGVLEIAHRAFNRLFNPIASSETVSILSNANLAEVLGLADRRSPEQIVGLLREFLGTERSHEAMKAFRQRLRSEAPLSRSEPTTRSISNDGATAPDLATESEASPATAETNPTETPASAPPAEPRSVAPSRPKPPTPEVRPGQATPNHGEAEAQSTAQNTAEDRLPSRVYIDSLRWTVQALRPELRDFEALSHEDRILRLMEIWAQMRPRTPTMGSLARAIDRLLFKDRLGAFSTNAGTLDLILENWGRWASALQGIESLPRQNRLDYAGTHFRQENGLPYTESILWNILRFGPLLCRHRERLRNLAGSGENNPFPATAEISARQETAASPAAPAPEALPPRSAVPETRPDSSSGRPTRRPEDRRFQVQKTIDLRLVQMSRSARSENAWANALNLGLDLQAKIYRTPPDEASRLRQNQCAQFLYRVLEARRAMTPVEDFPRLFRIITEALEGRRDSEEVSSIVEAFEAQEEQRRRGILSAAPAPATPSPQPTPPAPPPPAPARPEVPRPPAPAAPATTAISTLHHRDAMINQLGWLNRRSERSEGTAAEWATLRPIADRILAQLDAAPEGRERNRAATNFLSILRLRWQEVSPVQVREVLELLESAINGRANMDEVYNRRTALSSAGKRGGSGSSNQGTPPATPPAAPATGSAPATGTARPAPETIESNPVRTEAVVGDLRPTPPEPPSEANATALATAPLPSTSETVPETNVPASPPASGNGAWAEVQELAKELGDSDQYRRIPLDRRQQAAQTLASITRLEGQNTLDALDAQFLLRLFEASLSGGAGSPSFEDIRQLRRQLADQTPALMALRRLPRSDDTWRQIFADAHGVFHRIFYPATLPSEMFSPAIRTLHDILEAASRGRSAEQTKLDLDLMVCTLEGPRGGVLADLAALRQGLGHTADIVVAPSMAGPPGTAETNRATGPTVTVSVTPAVLQPTSEQPLELADPAQEIILNQLRNELRHATRQDFASVLVTVLNSQFRDATTRRPIYVGSLNPNQVRQSMQAIEQMIQESGVGQFLFTENQLVGPQSRQQLRERSRLEGIPQIVTVLRNIAANLPR